MGSDTMTLLHEDRLFPADATERAIARGLPKRALRSTVERALTSKAAMLTLHHPNQPMPHRMTDDTSVIRCQKRAGAWRHTRQRPTNQRRRCLRKSITDWVDCSRQ